MDLIEQAVFTSAQTDRSAGYQIVATSPGVCEADVRELSAWGPSHDALLCSAPNAVSINFHPLPSGSYCVSRTTPAGCEYSGRGGMRIYTQCLVVLPETLWRFANNPFALLRAAAGDGYLRAYEEVPKELTSLRLVGRAAVVDTALLSRLREDPGPQWLAAFVQAALGSVTVALAGGPPAEQLIAGLINCLPPECRTEFSFSTGLKFSSRRPFRVVVLSDDRNEQRRIKRLYGLAVLDLSREPPPEFAPIESWARLVERVLKSSQISFLSRQFSDRQSDLSPQDLPALGLQLLEELDASSLESGAPDAEPWTADTEAGNVLPSDQPPGRNNNHENRQQDGPPKPVESTPSSEITNPAEEITRAHEAHHRFRQDSSAAITAQCKTQAPSKHLNSDDPEILKKLERLDDLVYETIAGKSRSLGELESLWSEVRAQLGDTMLAESREQYLRYAMSIWEKCVDATDVRYSECAVRALDVLCLLFDEVEEAG